MTSPEDAYARGRLEGETAAHLASHDRRLDAINGHLGEVAGKLTDLILVVQKVSDQTSSNLESQRMVAQALTHAKAAAWSPWAKGLALVGGLAALVTLVATVVLLTGRP